MKYVSQMTDIVKSAKFIFENKDEQSHVHVKGRADYVTDIDLHVQQYLQSELKKAFPDIQFMGEEKDNSDVDFSGLVWILDPVDGTTNLIHDMHASVISLALAENRKIIAGVIFNPFTGDFWYAEHGCGAFLNGQPIHVDSAEKMEDSLIAIGTAPYYHQYADWSLEAAKRVLLRSQDIRRSGSAALELAYIAAGRLDGMFEIVLHPWDYGAGVCLIEEAGGKVTDFNGGPLDITKAGNFVASNGKIHDELLECLNFSC